MLKINLQDKAEKALKKIPVSQQHRIVTKIEALRYNPEPPGSRLLTGNLDLYRRIKVGKYRVVYFVEDNTLHIALIGKRGDVYRRMSAKRASKLKHPARLARTKGWHGA